MVKLLKRKKKDSQAIHESLQKGYGIEHPERIAGYAGFFYQTGDVYISDAIDRRIKQLPEFFDFVMESLEQFEDGEYGDISESDFCENEENRYLFGIRRLFGRYGFKMRKNYLDETCYMEIIKIRKWGDNTYIMYDSDLDTEMNLHWPG